MTQIELAPDLEQCIETITKREFNRVTKRLLVDPDEDQLMGEAALLGWFLETADFRRLRAISEQALLEGKKVVFRLSSQGSQKNYDLITG